MKKYAYKIVNVFVSREEQEHSVEKQLNDLGSQGWRVVQFAIYEYRTVWTLEREEIHESVR